MSLPRSSAQSQPGAAVRTETRTSASTYVCLRRYLVGCALLVACVCVLVSSIPLTAWRDLALLTALVVVASLIAVRLPDSNLTTYPGIPILFAIAGLYGASSAVLAAVISIIVNGFTAMPRSHRFRVGLYLPNISTQILSVGGSALLYVALEHWRFSGSGVHTGQIPQWRAWLALPLCSLIALLVNLMLTTTLVSLYEQKRWDLIWHNNYRWQLPSAVYMSPLSFLTAVLYSEHWWLGIGFIIVPVYALRMAVVTHERRMAAYRQGVELLGRIMQEAHPYTHGHLHRVAHWAKMIAAEMNLPAESMQLIEDAAILHDIGKVAVDDRVLNKVGKLTDADWAMIRCHPVTGADLVIQMSVLGKVGHWIRHHHERPDGQGYPDGLSEEAIPVESSIISVVDAFDAMVGGPAKEDQRPYRQPMSQEAAIAELRRHAGTQFHARVVEVFAAILLREQDLELMGQSAVPPRDLADDALWSSLPLDSGAFTLTAGS